MRAVRRSSTAGATGLALVAAAFFVLAPVGAPPAGCDDTPEGRLCIEGPIGTKGTFTTRYTQRPGRPATKVQLGYQRKDHRLTAFADWFGTERTQNGRAELAGTLATLPDECVRGVLRDPEGHTRATTWHCAKPSARH